MCLSQRITIDWQRARTLERFDYQENRHGFGHGVFAHGQLYTTDSDIDTGHGLIAVRDPDTLQVRREFPSAGIAATPNQDAWVVSNEHGELYWLDARTHEADPARGRRLPVMWDNHLVVG